VSSNEEKQNKEIQSSSISLVKEENREKKLEKPKKAQSLNKEAFPALPTQPKSKKLPKSNSQPQGAWGPDKDTKEIKK